MSIQKIFNQTKDVIINPLSFWETIFNEHISRREVILNYLFPMSLLIGIASLFGVLFQANIEDTVSIGYVVFNGLISFFIIFLEVYLSAWLIREISLSFESKTGSDEIFNLVIYSHAPFFLTLALYRLFPALFFFLIIGIYSFYIFWLGLERF